MATPTSRTLHSPVFWRQAGTNISQHTIICIGVCSFLRKYEVFLLAALLWPLLLGRLTVKNAIAPPSVSLTLFPLSHSLTGPLFFAARAADQIKNSSCCLLHLPFYQCFHPLDIGLFIRIQTWSNKNKKLRVEKKKEITVTGAATVAWPCRIARRTNKVSGKKKKCRM